MIASARLPLLAFVLVNAAAQMGWYLASRAELLGAASAGGGHGALFASWVAGAALAVALGLFGLGVAEEALSRGRLRSADWLAVLVEAGAFVVAVADTKTFRATGVHLYSPVVVDALGNAGVGRELELGAATSIGLFGAGVLAAEVALLIACRRFARGAPRAAAVTSGLALAALLASAAVALPLRARAEEGDPEALDALPLHDVLFGASAFRPMWAPVTYPRVTGAAPALARPKSVVFILVESLRYDALGPDLAPGLAARQRECLRSEHHVAGGHTTEFGVFTALYGVDTHHFVPFAAERTPSYPLAVLKARGYTLAGASASSLRDWNGAGFMLDAFDRYEEHLEEKDAAGDRAVADFALRFHRDHDRGRPFFLFLFLNATHHNYRYPPEFERHRPVMPEDYDHFLGDDRLAAFRLEIRNRYRNAVLATDALVTEILAAFDPEIARGEVLVVVTGDHGEEFWEHGLLGHGSTRFERERIEVPLLACGAGLPPRTVPLSGHVDLWPTLFDAMGAAGLPDAWSDGVSLLGPPPAERAIFVGGTSFPVRNRKACFVMRDRKVWAELCPGDAFCLRPTRVTTLGDERLEAPLVPAPAMARKVREFERFAPFR